MTFTRADVPWQLLCPRCEVKGIILRKRELPLAQGCSYLMGCVCGQRWIWA